MENNKKGGYGRRSEDRREYGDRSFKRDSENRNYGRRDFHEGERRERHYGDSDNDRRRNYSGERRNDRFGRNQDERRSFSDRPRGQYGERHDRQNGDRPYGDRPRNFGDRDRQFSDRPRNFGDRDRQYGDQERPRIHRERRSDSGYERDGGERRFSGERRSRYGNDRNFHFGEKKASGRRPRISSHDVKSEVGIEKMISRRPGLNPDAYSDNDMVSVPVKDVVRLNKYIANSGVCSRREADNMILAGVVTVNGEVVTELGTKVNINTDEVKFNGERLKGEAKVYIVMNKPKGFVTTASDPHADRTVMDLLNGCPSRVFPVGRLDKNTTGVLMFTNDGEMAEKLTHPSYDKKKIYQVSLSNKLAKEDYDKVLAGIELSDGVIAADELEYIDEEDHRKLGIEIHSGKNRIVRRIFESLGYDVKALDRVYFAGLTKRGLKRGEWRFLTEGEVNILRMGAYN